MPNLLLPAAILFGILPSVAMAQTVDWSSAFRFRTTGGFENPATLVAFNPQPEPPAYFIPTEVDLSEPTQLRMTIPDISVSKGGAQILFAVPENFAIEAEGEPNGEAFFLQTLGQGTQDVQFTMTSASGGFAAPGSWVSFNPQPEPPAGWIGMGFEFEFTSNSPATLVVQITDDGVAPLSFELIQAADFNVDSNVNDHDLKIWQENFGAGNLGDATLDGRTNGADFLVWQRQYAAPAGITVVPEPSGGMLVAILVLGAGLFRIRLSRSMFAVVRSAAHRSIRTGS